MGGSASRTDDGPRTDDAGDATFPRPPCAFTDGDGRTIGICRLAADDRSALAEFYDAFGPAGRAQGLPPRTMAAIESWLADIRDEGVNAVARHDDRLVGHGCLVPARDARHELAIFVGNDYRQAGIGRRLLRRLLGVGEARDVERVWLVVQPHNTAARRLYESAGFERTGGPAGPNATDIEMERRL